MKVEDQPFIINDRMRLGSSYLQVLWHEVPGVVLEHESMFVTAGRQGLALNSRTVIMCISGTAVLDIFYCSGLDFRNLKTQRWLRQCIREHALMVAETALPARLHWLENANNLYCNGVNVAKLRKNVLGCCTSTGCITLSPKIVLFPQRMSDVVMLHEMAHLKYMHHRKSFWNYLSVLIGEDANSEKIKSDLAYCQRSEMIDWLMK